MSTTSYGRSTPAARLCGSACHLRDMVEHGPAGQGVATPEGLILEVNPALCTLLGRRRDEVVGRSFWDFIHPEDLPVAGGSLARLLAGQAERDVTEVRFVRDDGALVEVETTASLLRDAAGRPDRLIAVIHDLSERRRAEAALGESEERARQASLHDRLTGAVIRNLFLDRTEAALARASHSGRFTAVLFLDLDRFKLVNDTLGHQVGDELLVQIAARLRDTIRSEDTLGRLGGDEFAVLCEELPSPDDALSAARRIRAALAPAFELSGRLFFASASIGVAVAGAHTDVAGGLLRQADTAMHRAKSAGRDRIESFGPAMEQEAADALQLGADLHDALERGELRIFHQPVLQLRDGAVVGTEALLRWQHPARGLIGPDKFIPLAEDTGLIVPIGTWVLEEACRSAAQWPPAPGGERLKVSVNVSARQLRDVDFVATVAQALRVSGLAPSALCLEITESLLMADVEQSRAVLSAVKDLGVRLSVDDFGTGYSSLARLKRFPIDYLKIDRSFVNGLGDDEDDEAIVAAILSLAHALGLAVVAEGVETEAQLRLLRDLRCEAGQGWLWSKAVPEPEFLAWLAARQAAARPGTRAGGRPATGVVRSRTSAAPYQPAMGRPARVLVVDDDPDQLKLAGLLLGAAGHEVIAVADPFSFLELLRQSQPDLVLMDLRMPGRGGLDLVQDLGDDATGLPPVVAVTGHAEWLGRPLEGSECFAGVITKPIDPDAFAAQVEEFLAGAAAGSARN